VYVEADELRWFSDDTLLFLHSIWLRGTYSLSGRHCLISRAAHFPIQRDRPDRLLHGFGVFILEL
jgi:hypothetical protein